MANKRMFSKQITTSDAFVDMPMSSQLLYFHLNMEADDDGFVSNPNRITRIIGASPDDLKILLAKRFLLSFENGVVVIKHWLLHNAVRKDMYKETQYLDEKKMLQIKENGVYTEVRNESVTKPLHRIDKIRLDKNINGGKLLTNIESIMYNYVNVDESGNPIGKKRLKRINKDENTELIKVGLLWQKMCAEYLNVEKEEVVMKNIYYPIRSVYDRDKFTLKDFKGLFDYFLNDKAIKNDNKMSFDLCMSEKYVAKYKLAKRSNDKPVSNAQIAEKLKL